MAVENQIKRKHRFNIFDLFIIICIVAVLAVATVVFIAPVLLGIQSNNGNTVDIVYQLRIENVFNNVNLNLQRDNTIYEIVRSEPIGTIQDITVEPTKYIGKNTLDGSVVTSVLPNRKTVYITVKAKATLHENKYYVGEQTILIGENFTVRTNGFTGYMSVVDLQEVQNDE